MLSADALKQHSVGWLPSALWPVFPAKLRPSSSSVSVDTYPFTRQRPDRQRPGV